MNQVKTIEQIEFCDLYARLKARNISQRDVARELKLTPSQISQILKGKRGTSALRVDKLREYVAMVCGDMQNVPAPSPRASGPPQVFEKLSDLQKYDPLGYKLAMQTIEMLYSRLPDRVATKKPEAGQLTEAQKIGKDVGDRVSAAHASSSQGKKDSDDKLEEEADRILLEGIEDAKLGHK